MDELEKEAVQGCFNNQRQNLDALVVGNELYKNGNIPKDVFHTLRNFQDNNVTALDYLLEEVKSHCCWEVFIGALYLSGYSQKAQELDNFLHDLKGEPKVEVVYHRRQQDGKPPHYHKRYFTFLSWLHNGVFKDPIRYLKTWNRKLKRDFRQACGEEKQMLADKLELLLSIEMDAHVMLGHPSMRLFHQLYDVIKFTTHTTMSKVMYYGRRGLALAVVGEFEESDQMITIARQYIHKVRPCFDLVYAYYCVMYINLLKFERGPRERFLAEMLDAYYAGKGYLAEADEDESSFWHGLLISRLVCGLMGIGVRLNKIPGWQVSDQHVDRANRLLANMPASMELRRKMIYYFLRSQISEFKGELSLAYEATKKAIGLAEKGSFPEQQLAIHLQGLEEKVKSKVWEEDGVTSYAKELLAPEQ